MSRILAAQLENERATKQVFTPHTTDDLGKAHTQNYHPAADHPPELTGAQITALGSSHPPLDSQNDSRQI